MNSHGVSAGHVDAPACGTIDIDGGWQTDFLAEGIEPFWIPSGHDLRTPALV